MEIHGGAGFRVPPVCGLRPPDLAEELPHQHPAFTERPRSAPDPGGPGGDPLPDPGFKRPAQVCDRPFPGRVAPAAPVLVISCHSDCPDPISTFIGVPVTGDDYNAGMVRCRARSLDAIAANLLRIANQKISQ